MKSAAKGVRNATLIAQKALAATDWLGLSVMGSGRGWGVGSCRQADRTATASSKGASATANRAAAKAGRLRAMAAREEKGFRIPDLGLCTTCPKLLL